MGSDGPVTGQASTTSRYQWLGLEDVELRLLKLRICLLLRVVVFVEWQRQVRGCGAAGVEDVKRHGRDLQACKAEGTPRVHATRNLKRSRVRQPTAVHRDEKYISWQWLLAARDGRRRMGCAQEATNAAGDGRR
jgi:hypothetical protein